MDVKKLYNNIVIKKDSSFLKFNLNSWPKTRYEAAVKFINIKPTSKVLDVGFGNGDLLNFIFQKTKYTYGVEVSKKKLMYVNNLLPLKANLSLQDISNKTNFKNDFFNIIFLTDVFEHIIDRYSVMNELKRILKKDGIIVIITPNIAKLKSRIRLLFGIYPFTSEDRVSEKKKFIYDGGHIQWYTFKTISSLAKQFDLNIEKRFGYGLFGQLHNIYPSLLSGSIAIILKK